MSALLQVRDLSVSFGRGAARVSAVDGLSYDLHAGETLAIVGESGSGKSVSSMALLGLLPPRAAHIDSGQTLFDGQDLLRMNDRQMRSVRGNRIAMIFQEPMTSLTPVLRIGQQLTEALVEHRSLSQRAARAKALEMLRLVDLSDPPRRMRQFPHELSGGMRQRVMIAMAMALEPDILIADEPTTALDVTVQAEILNLMRDVQACFGMAILLITHDMGVVAEMADRVVVMHRGKKVEEGPVRAIFDSPKAAYTASLLAAVPRLGARSAEDGPRPIIAQPAEPGEVVLHAEGMSKVFPGRGGIFGRSSGTVAMEEVGFRVRAGETLALVGESGSGKSTSGRAVLRLLEVDAGRIELEGDDMRTLSARSLRKARRAMQMVFQDPFAALNPRISIGRLIAEPMVIHGIARGSELEDRVAALLRRVGLEPEHMKRFAHEFSGGQRQRICIARALSVGPKLIVADEPTSALDVSVQAQVLELMLELQQSMGLAYLFISHDMAVVEEMAHRVAVMRQGRIVEMGPRRDVLNAPRHPYTAALLAAVPKPDPSAPRQKLPRLDLKDLPMGRLAQAAHDHWVAR
ncbi:MAG: ABC transporter ATP-binding protein [Rhodobacteraceae bacterium]|nr:MAG: ABC transporter ATP-binding protein [Paracoccaceae bacterium]